MRLTEQGRKEAVHRLRLNVATPTARLSVVEEYRLDLLLEDILGVKPPRRNSPHKLGAPGHIEDLLR